MTDEWFPPGSVVNFWRTAGHIHREKWLVPLYVTSKSAAETRTWGWPQKAHVSTTWESGKEWEKGQPGVSWWGAPQALETPENLPHDLACVHGAWDDPHSAKSQVQVALGEASWWWTGSHTWAGAAGPLDPRVCVVPHGFLRVQQEWVGPPSPRKARQGWHCSLCLYPSLEPVFHCACGCL